MTLSIMPLNMRKLRRFPKRHILPIQVPQPLMDMRIPTTNIPNIRLEMLHVHHIKPHNRRKKSHIHLRDILAEIIRAFGLRKMFLHAIERCEELVYSFGVCFLGGGEARAVDAVVDAGVDPLVCCVDVFL